MKKKTKILSLAFVMPIIIYLIVFMINNVYPFGDNTLLISDMNNEYISHFNYYRNALLNDFSSTFYSLSRTMGGNMIGVWGYYLMSPFNILLLLFNTENMIHGITLLLLLKFGLMSLSFCYANYENISNKKYLLIISISYSLMSYVSLYFHNVMWLDAIIFLPLVIKGLKDLIYDNKFLIYTIFLAITIISNYYIGFMACIFLFFYFISEIIFVYKRDYLKTTIRFIGYSLLAVGISTVILIPTVLSLSGGKAGFNSEDFILVRNFGVVEFIEGLFTCRNDYSQIGYYSTPSIYSGILMVILFVNFILNYKDNKKNLFKYLFLLLILFISLFINPIDLVWHGLSVPACFMYRYAFLWSFVMCEIGLLGIKYLQGLSNRNKAIIVIIIGSLMLISIKDIDILILNIFLLITLVMFINSKWMIIIVIIDLLLNTSFIMRELQNNLRVSYSKNMSVISKIEDIIDEIKLNDSNLYRIENIDKRSLNDSMMFNYDGLSHTSSTEQMMVLDALQHLGLPRYDNLWAAYDYGATKLIDDLFGIKYIISNSEELNYPISFEKNDYKIYLNEDANGIAHLYSNEILDIKYEGDIFEFQNKIASVIGNKYNYVKLIGDNEYRCANYGNIYLYLDNSLLDNGVFINGNRLEGRSLEYNKMINLGYFNKDDLLKIEIVDKDGDYVIAQEIEYTNNINHNLDLIKFNNTNYKINLSNNNGIVMLSIPYDTSWEIKIDGNKVDPIKVLDCFLGIKINENDSNITLNYKCRGVIAGSIISLMSILILIFLMVKKDDKIK